MKEKEKEKEKEKKRLRTRFKMITLIIFLLSIFTWTHQVYAATFFVEHFEDNSFASRGWYDNPRGTIDAANAKVGTGAFLCSMPVGSAGCSGGAPARHLFTPTNSIYVSFWVKYSANYIGTGTNSGPHEFYIITTRESNFEGLSYNYLDFYIQQTVGTDGGGVPAIQIQDGKMIDITKIGTNLIGVTENRAVAGCNGVGNTGGVSVNGVFGGSNCFRMDTPNPGDYWNQYLWLANGSYFKAQQGPYYKNDWHFIEVFAQLNTISNGIGQNDGIVKYWYDGNLLINVNNAIMRTGASPTMQFNQFVIGPYLGNGSTVNQSMWIDELTVASDRPNTNPPPAPPQNLQVK
ncbi:MAG: hypothetical protein EPO39_18255 [Candidatus Manganitrophaceae bacterium]|nr:MAG: hypothetical protein EPO39_18255 [Candidatus Manganitrophaceae bacterium]